MLVMHGYRILRWIEDTFRCPCTQPCGSGQVEEALKKSQPAVMWYSSCRRHPRRPCLRLCSVGRTRVHTPCPQASAATVISKYMVERVPVLLSGPMEMPWLLVATKGYVWYYDPSTVAVWVDVYGPRASKGQGDMPGLGYLLMPCTCCVLAA